MIRDAYCHLLEHTDLIYACLQILDIGEEIGLKHFKPVKPLGAGDTGRYVCFP